VAGLDVDAGVAHASFYRHIPHDADLCTDRPTQVTAAGSVAW
jgi:hypothetical protein